MLWSWLGGPNYTVRHYRCVSGTESYPATLGVSYSAFVGSNNSAAASTEVCALLSVVLVADVSK